ncbi:MAG TPA: FKBP-type peptidyl-prolyl cis-trans isomerase [Polyangiaceae bacterium]|nr:FKBP-type peptidyl-prolyl cis-trans isomerase [Polyangiaceae bacterium]
MPEPDDAFSHLRRVCLPLLLLAGACGGPAVPAASKPTPEEDAKAVLAQELGEAPAPAGPCPERSQPHVLEDPRAAVHRTGIGLAYCILTEGPPGTVPGATDTVKVHYTGWTEEGEMFDSSVDRGQPIDFALNQVIRGWGEGLRLMTPGDKARLWIPGTLGYGRREPGEGAGTPPKGTLIFDVELLDVQRAPPEPSPAAEVPADAEKEGRPSLAPRNQGGQASSPPQ